MKRRWSAGLGAIAATAACWLSPTPAHAQAWDTGRNMFGFSQYYPGSGWSSFYHPDFDPDAFFPTTFGWRFNHPGGRAAPPPAPLPGVVRPQAGPARGRGRLFRRHHPR